MILNFKMYVSYILSKTPYFTYIIILLVIYFVQIIYIIFTTYYLLFLVTESQLFYINRM